jgi:hypothetical protein
VIKEIKMSVEQLTEFFKWMTIINIGILIFSAILIMSLRKFVCKMHGKMFGISEENVSIIMYCYLGVFKIFVITFNIVPYIALHLLK